MVPMIPPTIAPTSGPFAASLVSTGTELPVPGLYIPERVAIPCVGSEPKGAPNWSVDEGRTEPLGALSVGPSPLAGAGLSTVEAAASEWAVMSICAVVAVFVGGGKLVTGPSVGEAENAGAGMSTTADVATSVVVGVEVGVEGGPGTGGWVVRVG